jgi:hypothetical protein
MANILLPTYRPGACPSLRVAERPGSFLQGLDKDVSPPAHSAGRPAFFAKSVLGTVAVDLKGNVTATAQKRGHRFLVEAGMLHRGCVQLTDFGAVDPRRQMGKLAFAADFEKFRPIRSGAWIRPLGCQLRQSGVETPDVTSCPQEILP